MVLLTAFVTFEGLAQAQEATLTVNSTNDVDDGTCDATHCSLREAINVANGNAGKDTVAFNIAGTGPHTIQPASPLPTITDPVIIDGYTQTGASPNTNGSGLGLNTVLKIELDGTNAGTGASANGLLITAGDSTVRGLAVNRFADTGLRFNTNGGNVIEGNFIGTDVAGTAAFGNAIGVQISSGAINDTIGGVAPAARNIISGNQLWGVTISFGPGNLVQGNLIGTDITGAASLGNISSGVLISQQASGNTVGGTVASARNTISGNTGDGVFLEDATGNLVQGNFIGTDVTGTAALGNRYGVFAGSSTGGHIASNNTIGGTDPGAGNVVSGNSLAGVNLSNQATGNLVQGNFIGTQVDGTSPLGNSGPGVQIVASGVTDNTIGGTATGAPNVIAHNGSNGVSIFFSAAKNAVLSNSIFSNTGLGIELGTDGVTSNDAEDADTGANNLQNFPVVTNAEIDGSGNVEVQYSVDSATGNSAYPLRIEFFKADADGQEGKTFLGSDIYPASSAQSASVATLVNAEALGVGNGDVIVATGTDADNNTSEFSQNVQVTVAPTPTPIPSASRSGLIAMASVLAAFLLWRMGRPRSRKAA